MSQQGSWGCKIGMTAHEFAHGMYPGICPKCGGDVLTHTFFKTDKIWDECVKCGWPDEWKMDYLAALRELGL